MSSDLLTLPNERTDQLDLTREEYEQIRKLVYAHSGINLGDKKSQLVRVRLGKLVRQGGFHSYGEYCRAAQADASGRQLALLLDAITTNTTHLFRESRHFDLLRRLINEWAPDRAWRAHHQTLRIWSSACSSGEEPHSIAMVAHDALSRHTGVELKILATDLSTHMLDEARIAAYEPHRVGTVPADLRARYLHRAQVDGTPMLQLVPELRRLITFARFNLMSPKFPFSHGFHVIFCRNVMIYFDRPTQETLVAKLAGQLLPGGYLMIGHSESLNGIDHPLTYVEPTIYRK